MFISQENHRLWMSNFPSWMAVFCSTVTFLDLRSRMFITYLTCDENLQKQKITAYPRKCKGFNVTDALYRRSASERFTLLQPGKIRRNQVSGKTRLESHPGHWTNYDMTHFKLFPHSSMLRFCYETHHFSIFGTHCWFKLDSIITTSLGHPV